LDESAALPRQTSRIELHLAHDPRLLPGVIGAVAHFADRAGLDPAAQMDLTSAVEQAFSSVLPLLEGPSPKLTVRVEDFADRVQVVLEHQGRPWEGPAEKQFSKVDRVKRESSGDLSRLVLIEYVAPATQQ
jgi:hypothetical protein